MNTFIRLLYALLIATAVVTFVAVSMYTFYPAPKAPTYPTTPVLEKGIAQQAPGSGTTPAPTAADDYQRAYDAYTAAQKVYERNVSIIVTAIAAGIVVLGLWLRSRSEIIGEGLALGGIGNSIYAVVAASIADDRIMRFVAVTLFLASVLVVVYFKFNDNQPLRKSVRKR